MDKIKAKFIGDDTNKRTQFIGLKTGVKYDLIIGNARLFERFLDGVEFFAIYRRNGKTFRIPYGSREAFLLNWKLYRKGGGAV